MGEDRQEGWQMVSLVEGSGWLVQRRTEGLCQAQDGVPGLLRKSAVCPLPVCLHLSDRYCSRCQQLRISLILLKLLLTSLGDRGPERGRQSTGNSCYGRGRRSSGYWEKHCWVLLKHNMSCCLTHTLVQTLTSTSPLKKSLPPTRSTMWFEGD